MGCVCSGESAVDSGPQSSLPHTAPTHQRRRSSPVAAGRGTPRTLTLSPPAPPQQHQQSTTHSSSRSPRNQQQNNNASNSISRRHDGVHDERNELLWTTPAATSSSGAVFSRPEDAGNGMRSSGGKTRDDGAGVVPPPPPHQRAMNPFMIPKVVDTTTVKTTQPPLSSSLPIPISAATLTSDDGVGNLRTTPPSTTVDGVVSGGGGGGGRNRGGGGAEDSASTTMTASTKSSVSILEDDDDLAPVSTLPPLLAASPVKDVGMLPLKDLSPAISPLHYQISSSNEQQHPARLTNNRNTNINTNTTTSMQMDEELLATQWSGMRDSGVAASDDDYFLPLPLTTNAVSHSLHQSKGGLDDSGSGSGQPPSSPPRMMKHDSVPFTVTNANRVRSGLQQQQQQQPAHLSTSSLSPTSPLSPRHKFNPPTASQQMPPNPPPYHPNNNAAGGGSHTVSPKHHNNAAAARASPSSLLGVGASGLPPLPPSVGGSATLSTVSSSSLLGSGHYNNRRRSNSTSASLASEGLHRDLSGSSLSGSGLSGVPMQQHPHLQLVPPSTATPMSMHSPAVSIGGMGTMGMGGGPLMTAIPSAQSVPLSIQSLTPGGGVGGGGNGGGESSSADTFIPARSKRRLTSELDEPPSASNLLSVQQTALGKRTSLSSTTSSSHNSQRLSISVGQPLLDAPGHGSSVSLRSSALSDIPDPSVGSLSQQLSAGGAGASWFALQNDRRGSSLSISSPTSTNAAAGRVAVGFFETPGDEPSSAASAAAFRQHRVPSHSGAVTDSVYLENANRPRVSPTSGNRGGGAVGRGFNFPQLGIGAPAAQVGPPQVTQLYHLLQGGSGGAVGNVSNSTQQHQQQHQQFPQASLQSQSQSSSVSSPSFMGGTQNFTPSSVNHWAPNGSGSVSTRGNHNVMAPSAGGGVGGGSGGVDLVLGHVGDSGSHTPQQHQQQHGIRGGGAAAASGGHQPSPAAHHNASHNHNNTNTNTTTASSNPVREFEGENSYSEVPLIQMSGIARRQRDAYSSPIGGPTGGPNFLASGSGQEDLSGVVEGGIDGVMPSAPDIALQLHLSHASLSSVASRGGFGNTYTNNLTRQLSGANHSNSNTNYNPNGSMRIHNAPPALLHNIPASINASGVVIVSNPQGGVMEYHQGAPEIQGHRADGGARPMNRWPGRSFSIGVDGASPYSGTPPHRMNSTRSQQSFVLEPNAPGWLHSSRGSIAELNDSLATPSLASGRHDASSTTNAAAVYLSELAAAVASGAAAPTQQPLDRPHMQIVRNLHRVAPQAEDDGSMVTIHGKTLVFGPAAADEDDDDDVSGGAVRLLDGSGSVVDDAEVRSFSSATGLDGATTAAPPAAVQRPPGTDQGGG